MRICAGERRNAELRLTQPHPGGDRALEHVLRRVVPGERALVVRTIVACAAAYQAGAAATGGEGRA